MGRRISLVGRNRLDEGGHVVFCRLDHDPKRLGLNLEPEWQMMGALEAADGMLLFGISTAFVFVVPVKRDSSSARRLVSESAIYNGIYI